MRHIGVAIALLLVMFTAGPVATQPWGPLGPRPKPVLNGCTESALFAVFNSAAGKECLRYLPTYANAPTEFSVFCQGGRWGCCVKSIGFGGCKIEEAIPYQRRVPPVAVDPR